MPISSRELLRELLDDGWVHVRTTGDHWHFKHPTKPGLATLVHPMKDIPIGTEKSIRKQAGLQRRKK